MSLLTVIVVLLCVALVVGTIWYLPSPIPMTFKRVILWVAVAFVVFWILSGVGILDEVKRVRLHC